MLITWGSNNNDLTGSARSQSVNNRHRETFELFIGFRKFNRGLHFHSLNYGLDQQILQSSNPCFCGTAASIYVFKWKWFQTVFSLFTSNIPTSVCLWLSAFDAGHKIILCCDYIIVISRQKRDNLGLILWCFVMFCVVLIAMLHLKPSKLCELISKCMHR